MKSILLFAFLLFLSNSFAQLNKRVYLNEDLDTCELEHAKYYIENKPSKSLLRSINHIYYLDGTLRCVQNYVTGSPTILDGPYYSFYKNGQIKDSMFFLKNKKNGIYREYFENGQLKLKGTYVNDEWNDSLLTFYLTGTKKRIDYYNKGQLIKGALFDENGRPITYSDYFVEAQFPGGLDEMMKFIVNSIEFPEDALAYDISGIVHTSFKVDSLGKVSNIRVLRSISPILSEAAIKAVEKMPNWIPAKIDNENVESYFGLPINFDLEYNTDEKLQNWYKNVYWKKKEKLLDPVSNEPIQVRKKGVTTLYYREKASSESKSISLSVTELENFVHLKFINKTTCDEWYRLYNDTMFEIVKNYLF